MHETLIQSSVAPVETSDGIRAEALRAEAWAGEPFLRPDDDPARCSCRARRSGAPSTTRSPRWPPGCKQPSPEWKVRYALMLGLERVLSEKPPHLASGTELRRHQVDALAGMLTELIAAVEKRDGGHERQRQRERHVADELADEEDDEDDELSVELEEGDEADEPAAGRARPGRRAALPLPPPDRVRQDDRRRRLRRGGAHGGRPDPHAPPPAREPVPARADRPRLRRPPLRHRRHRRDAAPAEPDHDPDLRLVRAARRRGLALGLPARDLRRGAHGPRREDLRRDPPPERPDLHRHDRDRGADREAGLGRLPGLRRRPAARGRRAARPDRAASLPARAAGRGDQLGADRRRRLRGARARRRPRPRGAEHGRGDPLPRALRRHARASSTPPASTTPTTSPPRSAPPASRRRPCPAARRR